MLTVEYRSVMADTLPPFLSYVPCPSLDPPISCALLSLSLCLSLFLSLPLSLSLFLSLSFSISSSLAFHPSFLHLLLLLPLNCFRQFHLIYFPLSSSHYSLFFLIHPNPDPPSTSSLQAAQKSLRMTVYLFLSSSPSPFFH